MKSLHKRSLKLRLGPSGIHLFNRQTGLNVLIDEVRVSPSLWARAPRQVSIALTNDCDLSCPFCFAPKEPASLDFGRVTRWLDELDKQGCLGIGFGGGEPTLYPQLVELCHYAAERTGLAVTLTTHGHGLDNKLISALTGAVHFLRVSMDGVGATYESLRGRPFNSLREVLRKVRSLGPFGINYIVNSSTFPDLDAAVQFAAAEGASEFLLLPEQAVFGNGGIDEHTLSRLRSWVKGYGGNIPLAVSEQGSDGMPICRALDESGLTAYAHIDAAGTMKRSSYDLNGVVIGDEGIIKIISLLRDQGI